MQMIKSASITFKISVNNINEAPTFTLSNRMVDDTAAAGTVIGALASTDAEGDDVTFALVWRRC